MAAFPSSLFLTLLGVTLLFGVAQANGTLARADATRALRACGGVPRCCRWLFFVLACVGRHARPGRDRRDRADRAARDGGRRARPACRALLTALMVANGANAGNLSPFSAVGVIVQSLHGEDRARRARVGRGRANFVAHVLSRRGGVGCCSAARACCADAAST